VIIPEKNKKDLSEIPKNVKRKLRFVPVRNMDEVLAIALENAPPQKASKPKKKSPRAKRKPAGTRR
jgi:ATP-dependent Lon protease